MFPVSTALSDSSEEFLGFPNVNQLFNGSNVELGGSHQEISNKTNNNTKNNSQQPGKYSILNSISSKSVNTKEREKALLEKEYQIKLLQLQTQHERNLLELEKIHFQNCNSLDTHSLCSQKSSLSLISKTKFDRTNAWVERVSEMLDTVPPPAEFSDLPVPQNSKNSSTTPVHALPTISNKLDNKVDTNLHGPIIFSEPAQTHSQAVTEKTEETINKFIVRQTMAKELPIFSGEPGEWIYFISQFHETTKLCGFTDAENILRLKKSLKGKAYEAVAALLNFTKEVDNILEILENIFGRPEVIIQNLLESVKSFPSLKEDNLGMVLDFSLKVRNLVVTVQSLKCNEYLVNPQLINDLVNKLNSRLKMDWGQKIATLKKENKQINISEFSEWLYTIGQAAMYVTPTENQIKKRYVLTSNSSTQEQNINFRCKFCKKDHKIGQCSEFKKIDIKSRWDFVRTNKCCFSCLGSSHQTKFCKSKKTCDVNGCKFRHHTLLHSNETNSNHQATTSQELNGHVSTSQKSTEVVLRIAPIEISGPNGSINTYALFDEASTVTMIDESLARLIGTEGPEETLNLMWTNKMTSREKSKRVSLQIRGDLEEDVYTLENVRTVRQLNLPTTTINIKELSKKYDYLQAVEISSLRNAKPKILIGQDNIDLIIAREVIEGGKNMPILSKTKLGWVIHGNIGKSYVGRTDTEFTCFVNTGRDDELAEMVKESFRMENLGVKIKENWFNLEEERANKILENTTKRIDDNRWETGLLWKTDNTVLPNNKTNAFTRLRHIERKMDKNEDFAKEYKQKIEDYVNKGYARRIENTQEVKNVWYLPHFAVYNPNKPGKMRFVFDAAAKSSGVSLNDVLLKGPDLLNSLLGVIFNFRQRNIAFCGDIKEMFHQVKIRQEDRMAQRFLWRDKRRYGEPEVLEMEAMIFGAVSSPTSATYVMRKNAIEFENEFPNASSAIQKKFYVDDYLDSQDTIDQAKKLVFEVIEIQRRGGFSIRNWCSNSKELMMTIPSELRATTDKDFNFEKAEKVLGLFWNPNEDNFSFNLKWKQKELQALSEKKVTKREVLKIAMTIFDPFGFLSCFTIKARILLQDIWKSKTDWDEIIKQEHLKRWKNWVYLLDNITSIKIPRCYVSNISDAIDIQLHTFVDASSQAYSAVSYLRINKPTCTEVSFVMAKSRVAPLKPTSIPRLELQAAVLGTRLAITIKENHTIPISKLYFWSDSKAVISWINSENFSLFKPFVGHRITEITESTTVSNWNWLPTEQNVADEATREEGTVQKSFKNRWFNGPKFLTLPKENWPSYNVKLETDLPELKKKFVVFTVSVITSKLKECLPNIKHFSSWLKLLRSTAWVLRFTDKKRTYMGQQELAVHEIVHAENIWIKVVQDEDFCEEINYLENGKNIDSKSKIFTLSPMLDSTGILRAKSRLINSNDLSDDTKYPIILNPKNYFTKLLVKHYHVQANHVGQNLIINEIRQRYWILNVRQAVKSCWNACGLCKFLRVTPDIPEMAPLPEYRLKSYVRPFTISGVDFFGPLKVTVGRRQEKRYGVLFTCLSTRAIHLEVAHSLTTDSMILALRRMISRRGYPTQMFSDNGTNLRGAELELRNALKELDQERITSFLSAKRIDWHFNPPAAPHMGGCWERLIQSVKKSFYAVLNERAPRDEVLLTLLIESENIVNSRPLVDVSLDHEDEEALTPNHFLLGTSSAAQVPGFFDKDDINSKKQWRIAQELTNHFWKRWIREYLPVLTKRTKWFTSSKKPLEVGDVVVIIDENLIRNLWPKGIITKTYRGNDGNVRVVDVKTQFGQFKRPVTKICKLDVKGES